ncbi:DNA-binding transcriptional regulator, GntR family [Meinhardsimonia xiamenensis]|uniref:DNA-binding transcriptional regulator, GntR family n=1 Tax=Meinhardsimonia xiamenensis TaxID=990712 RepID=A0A1G9CA09_9RHOB|nr:GntR family transcriptional regulator [Meinhardsimonia xiamenensis]PRX38437.1 GntR family transcriptional regulator [Meinhardsimonia xiamenensis]SDK48497.1 DNA-binding transcriptional regulator, GntR family [Meinhardsimonia xiamenensis]
MTDSPTEKTQGHDAYARILADIREGRILPGDRLTETELARRYGLSRTPVREAIRQLEADGLVAHVPRAGATLRRLEPAEVSELYEMRAVLEATAARFAARAAAPVELAELSALNEAFATAATPVEAAEINRQFHAALMHAARNRFLTRAMEAVRKTFLILGPSTMEEEGRVEAAAAEHAEVLAALQARDEAAAEAAMRAHIEAAHRARLRQLRSGGGEGQ